MCFGCDYLFSGTGGEKACSGLVACARKNDEGDVRSVASVPARLGLRMILRRTVATRIAEQLGIGGEQIIKRVLGHSDGSVTAIYNRYGYVKEMRRVARELGG